MKGTSGGTGLLVHPSMGTHAATCKHSYWTAVPLKLQNVKLHVISLYLHSDLGIAFQTVRSSEEYMSQIAPPYIIVGDFNRTPEEIHEMNLSFAQDMNIIAPDVPTCKSANGAHRTIDFFLVHKSIARHCSAAWVTATAAAPHYAVHMGLHVPHEPEYTNTVNKPKPLPPLDKEKDMPAWHEVYEYKTFESLKLHPSVEQYVRRLNYRLDDHAISHEFLSWSHAVESFVQTQTGIERTGVRRGQPPTFQEKKVLPKRIVQHKSHVLDFWLRTKHNYEQLKYAIENHHNEHRDNLFRHFAHLEMPHEVYEYLGSHEKEWNRYFKFAHRFNIAGIDKLVAQIGNMIEAVRKYDRQLNQDNRHEWIGASLKKGGGALHSYTRGTTRAPPLPTSILSETGPLRHPVDKHAYYQKFWRDLWRQHKREDLHRSLDRLKQLALDEDLGIIGVDLLCRAIRLTEKNIALGLDLWDPSSLRLLTLEALQCLADLLQHIEREVEWPMQLLSNLVILSVDSRLTTLLTLIYRIWSKLRRHQTIEREAENAGEWDKAVRGSSALRAAVFSAYQDEKATYSGQEIGALLYDMQKFYDSTHIPTLIDRAIELGFLPKALYLSLTMHLAPRIMKAYDHYGDAFCPIDSICAGCTNSNGFARILLHKVMSIAHTHYPSLEFRQFVDDLRQTTRHESIDVVVDASKKAAGTIVSGLLRAKCVLSPKSTVVASKVHIAKTIVARLRGFGMTVKMARVAKDLGVDTTAGSHRSVKTIRSRLNSTKL